MTTTLDDNVDTDALITAAEKSRSPSIELAEWALVYRNAVIHIQKEHCCNATSSNSEATIAPAGQRQRRNTEVSSRRYFLETRQHPAKDV